MNLKGISALVTGANRGLGKAFVTELLAAVERDEAGTLFPDDGAITFWTNFKADPASTLFVVTSAKK